jgi:hypothetical protein
LHHVCCSGYYILGAWKEGKRRKEKEKEREWEGKNEGEVGPAIASILIATLELEHGKVGAQ